MTKPAITVGAGALALITICSVALAPVSAAVASGPVSSLRLDVAEWSIVPSDGLVRAGDVRLTVRNLGVERHEVRIVRTRTWGRPAPHAPAVGEPLLVAPGETASETLVLAPGSYEALDDLPGHAAAGARVFFSVTA